MARDAYNRVVPPWMVPAPPAARPANVAPQGVNPIGAPGSVVTPSPVVIGETLAGDADTIVINGAQLVDSLALTRPPHGMRRTLLIVFNGLATGDIFFVFGRNADNGATATRIGAQLNLFLDQYHSIPQNDLHLFFSAAGAALVTYVNAPWPDDPRLKSGK